jgi:Flp pilus assembly pilin Flp
LFKVRKLLTAFWADESGISSVEYALLLAFVGGGIILAADSLAEAVADEMNETAACISGSISAASC